MTLTIGGFSSAGGKRQKIVCRSCYQDITLALRFRCLECVNHSLCGDCFAVGVELLPHKRTHSYRVVECLENNIFSKEWSLNEELLLLELIERFGMGNWKTISEKMLAAGIAKSVKELETHYWETYLGRHGYCLPSNSIMSGEMVPTAQIIINGDGKNSDESDVNDPPKGMSMTLHKDHSLGEQVVRDVGKGSGHKESKSGRGGNSGNDRHQEMHIREKIAQMPGADLPGYMPLREDFEVEWENDAELILADMEFQEDDHPSEEELKIQLVDIYNRKLQEREKRKQFVLERGIFDIKKQLQAEKKYCKEDRELISKLRMFARFQSDAEHQHLVDGILKASKLRKQIELCQHYRSLGFRSVADVQEFEGERKKRDNELRLQKQRENTPYLFSSVSSAPRKSLSKHSVDVSLDGGDDSVGGESVTVKRDAEPREGCVKNVRKKKSRPLKHVDVIGVEDVESDAEPEDDLNCSVVSGVTECEHDVGKESDYITTDMPPLSRVGKGCGAKTSTVGMDIEHRRLSPLLSLGKEYSPVTQSLSPSRSEGQAAMYMALPSLRKLGEDKIPTLPLYPENVSKEEQRMFQSGQLPIPSHTYVAMRDHCVRDLVMTGKLSDEGIARETQTASDGNKPQCDFFVLNIPPKDGSTASTVSMRDVLGSKRKSGIVEDGPGVNLASPLTLRSAHSPLTRSSRKRL